MKRPEKPRFPQRFQEMAAKHIHGFMFDDELEWLAQQAENASTILEVGTYHGRSTAALCEYSTGLVVSVDDWSGPCDADGEYVDSSPPGEVLQQARDNLEPWVHAGRLLMLNADFGRQSIVSNLWGWCGVEFVFLDGDHSEEGFKRDYDLARELISTTNGTLLSGHDRHFPGVIKLLKEQNKTNHKVELGPGSIWFQWFPPVDSVPPPAPLYRDQLEWRAATASHLFHLMDTNNKNQITTVCGLNMVTISAKELSQDSVKCPACFELSQTLEVS